MARIEHHRLPLEVVQRQRPVLLGERMAGGNGGDEALLAQDDAAHRVVLEADPAEPDVDAAVFEGRNLIQRDEFDEGDVHIRRRRPEGADDLRQAAVDGRGDEADREAAAFGRHRPADHFAHVGDAAEHLGRLLEHQTADRRELQGARRAVEQFGADLGLELLDLTAERRWAMFSRAAARVTLRSSATATK